MSKQQSWGEQGFITSLVRDGGKIKIGTDCRKEWRECRATIGGWCFDQRRGVSPDEMATTLGFDDDDALREALLAEHASRVKRKGRETDEPVTSWQEDMDRLARTVHVAPVPAGWRAVLDDGHAVEAACGLTLQAFLESLGYVVRVSIPAGGLA